MITCGGPVVQGTALDSLCIWFLEIRESMLIYWMCLALPSLLLMAPCRAWRGPSVWQLGFGEVSPSQLFLPLNQPHMVRITCSAPFYLKSSRVWLIGIFWILLAFWHNIRRFQSISWSFLELLFYFHFSLMDFSLEDSPVNSFSVDLRNFPCSKTQILWLWGK